MMTRAPEAGLPHRRIFNVLFLCTGNSARSIIGESILRKDGAGRFNAYSAGSRPTGVVNPFALKVLESHNYPVDGLRSKSSDEFAQPDAPQIGLIITLCDRAAGEACPTLPGQPLTAHWDIGDPAAVEGGDSEKERAFAQAFESLRDRIGVFLRRRKSA